MAVMQLIDKTILQTYKDAIASIRLSLGRYVIVMMPAGEIYCPNCRYDVINKCSSNVYEPVSPYPSDIPGPFQFSGICPVCRGTGKIKTNVHRYKIKANIRWLFGDDRKVSIGNVEETCDVEVRNIPLRFKNEIENADFFLIDDKKVYLKGKPIEEGLRDLIKISFYCSYEKP